MSEFDALDETDKAYLIAYWRTVDRMEAWENQKREDALQTQTKRA